MLINSEAHHMTCFNNVDRYSSNKLPYEQVLFAISKKGFFNNGKFKIRNKF